MYRVGHLVLFFSLFSNITLAETVCETCAWPAPMTPTTESQALQCEDLYKAVCLNSNGKLKHNSSEANVPTKKEMQKFIQTAREKAVKNLGFSTYREFLIHQFGKNGIQVDGKATAQIQKLLVEKELVDVEAEELAAVFPQYSDCLKKTSIQLGKMADEKQGVDDLLKSNSEFIDQRLSYTKSLYQKSIPLFVSRIAAICKATSALLGQLGEAQEAQLGPEGQFLKNTCGDQLAIRHQGIEIYRKVGTKEYSRLSEQFVEKYFPIFRLGAAPSHPPKTDEEKAEALQGQLKYMQGICIPVGDLVSTQGRSTLVGLKEKLSSSKTLVEALIEKVFTPSRKKMVEGMYRRITKEILVLLSKFQVEPAEIAKIKSDYDSIVLSWLGKPAPESYQKDGDTGLEILSIGKSPLDELGVFYDLKVFNDQDLEFFTTYNASYMPTIQIGKSKKASTINLMPLMLDYLERNPWTIFETLSHEAGHNIGPQLSQVNGYNIAHHYTEVLACYSSTDSIRLVPGQEDETISDYLASEVLASVINELPSTKRVAAIYSAQEFSCEAESWEILANNADFKSFAETHPTMRLRIAGIQGGNPNLRKHMGCVTESTQFRTCVVK